MTNFKKTNAKIFAKPSQKVTQDTIYWKNFGVPVHLKEFGPIENIDFSPIEPYYFAVTSSAKVQIYNPLTKLVYKNLNRFKANAYGGKFRCDGRLLCAGGEEAVVKLFDVNTRSCLRVFKGHTSAVRKCLFTLDHIHVASFSDDKTVRLWDIATEQSIHEFSSHEDYVRAGAVSPVSPSTLISGSYDKKIRMFDSRTKNEAVFTVDHGHPVESVIFLPSGGIFISAGGTELRVWDALYSGRFLTRVSQHHKTITCLCLGWNNTRLLSGSLDRHVKIYDVSSYKVVHNMDYSNAILSIGVSNNDEVLAIGTTDGIVSVQRKEIKEVEKTTVKKKKSFRYSSDRLSFAVTDVVAHENKEVHASYDVHLRKFQYKKALQCTLRLYVTNKTPHITVSVFQELIRRKGLCNAIASSDKKSILAIFHFLFKYLGDFRFTRTLIDVSHYLLDFYENRIDTITPEILALLKKLKSRVQEENDLSVEMLGVGGTIKMLLSASSPAEYQIPSLPPVAPSESAQQNFVINVS